ncbi:MAG: ATP-binding protein [Candidatus Micrarchaeaceae archaeon]
MREEEILNVLADWNFWGKGIDTGIERRAYVNDVLRLLKSSNIVAELGVRRCGKSYIARQTIKELVASGLDKRNTLIINLNDERFEKGEQLLNEIYAAYRKHVASGKKTVIVIDEPQEINGWERFVRGVSERGEAKFIVTGSSSALLSSEFSTLLSGRHIPMEIMPLSFREFLYFNGIAANTKLEIAKNLLSIEKLLDEYILYGGFPDVVRAESKLELLGSYFDTILIKDVASRYKIRALDKLKALAKFYVTNISNSITYNSIAKFTKIPVKTVERLSTNIESSYVLFFVKRFSQSAKERENSPRKVYCIDNGMAVAEGFNVAQRKGALVENLVALELRRRGKEFYYWKDSATGKEVDFVTMEKKGIMLVQVADTIENPKTLEREVGSLEAATRKIKGAKSAVIILRNMPNESIRKEISSKGIEAKGLLSFLMEQ